MILFYKSATCLFINENLIYSDNLILNFQPDLLNFVVIYAL